jgi:hypothetical protein
LAADDDGNWHILSYFPITIISGLSKQIVARQITLIVGRKILWKLASSVNRNASNDRNEPATFLRPYRIPTPSNAVGRPGAACNKLFDPFATGASQPAEP